MRAGQHCVTAQEVRSSHQDTMLCVWMCIWQWWWVRAWQWEHSNSHGHRRGFIWSWGEAKFGGGSFTIIDNHRWKWRNPTDVIPLGFTPGSAQVIPQPSTSCPGNSLPKESASSLAPGSLLSNIRCKHPSPLKLQKWSLLSQTITFFFPLSKWSILSQVVLIFLWFLVKLSSFSRKCCLNPVLSPTLSKLPRVLGPYGIFRFEKEAEKMNKRFQFSVTACESIP